MDYINISRIATSVFSMGMIIGIYSQGFKIWKRRSAKDVSTALVVAMLLNEIAWFNYGLALHEWPIIAITLATLAGEIIITLGFIKYRKGDLSRKNQPKTDQNQKFWDIYAKYYGAIIGTSLSHRKMFEEALKGLDVQSGDKILDAGCGVGTLEKLIIKSDEKNYKIVALDFSKEMLARARKKIGDEKRIFFKFGDLNKKLNYSDNHFDKIILISALFSLPDAVHTLKEFFRVLKNGGRLVIVEPTPRFSIKNITFENFRLAKKLPLSRRIKFYIKTIINLPKIIAVVRLNEKMKDKIDEHLFKTSELKRIMLKLGYKIKHIKLTLAKQDSLIVAKK